MCSLYEDLRAAGCEIDHHESDLYVRATPAALAIMAKHGRRLDGHNVQRFTSQIDGKPWLDVPFAYEPWWEARNRL